MRTSTRRSVCALGLGKCGTIEFFLRVIDYSCGKRKSKTRRSRSRSPQSPPSPRSPLSPPQVDKRSLRDLDVSFVTFVLTHGFYCGSTSTVTFTPLACVVQPAAVYCSWTVSPLATEKLGFTRLVLPAPLASVAEDVFALCATSRTKN